MKKTQLEFTWRAVTGLKFIKMILEKMDGQSKLMANSMDNLFFENNFIANSFDVSTNSKQNFNTFGKNYWSNYSGYDLE